MKLKLIIAAIYFLVLYLIAFMAARGLERREDEIWFLGVSGYQWRALLYMWLPVLVIFAR